MAAYACGSQAADVHYDSIVHLMRDEFISALGIENIKYKL
jgi:hypothetical protein